MELIEDTKDGVFVCLFMCGQGLFDLGVVGVVVFFAQKVVSSIHVDAPPIFDLGGREVGVVLIVLLSDRALAIVTIQVR